jgi:hypothetical protein
MQLQHIILETDQLGNIKNIPKLPPNKKIEGIFFVLDDTDTLSPQMPHPDLAGQVQIFGSIFESVPEQDWEIFQ